MNHRFDAAHPGADVKERERDLAAALHLAERSHTERNPPTDDGPLDLDAAYRTQAYLIALRVGEGERVVGVKLGLTSRAKQVRMGIDAPLTAVLTDAMMIGASEPLVLDELIHPRLEPEIAFVLGEDLEGPGVTAARAMAAVDSVHAAVEIIDSRYIDFRFTLPDVVADNASSARFLISGNGHSPQGLDLALEGVLLSVNGAVVDSATGAAVQGHPGEALALAANSLSTRGARLSAGDIVLTGGMTDAVPVVDRDQVGVEFTTLGSLVLAVHRTEGDAL